MFAKNQHNILTQMPHTNCEPWYWRAENLGFVGATEPEGLEVIDQEFLCEPSNSRDNSNASEAICPTP